jgi:Hemerythrin HHE cation binding domain
MVFVNIMETTMQTQPAVTAFVLGQLRRLSDEAGRLERLAVERRDRTAIAEAMDRLRHRFDAHVVVEERLFVSPLRDSPLQGGMLALEDEHRTLDHRAAEVSANGYRATEVIALGLALRAHIARERRLVRRGSAMAADRLSQVAPWRAVELFECAGGPTETWPGEWLG